MSRYFPISALAIATCAAMLGCSGQSTQTTGSPTSSATEALGAVQSCKSEAKACYAGAGDAGGAACEASFHACLATLMPDAGWSFDFDAGERRGDAALPPLPSWDAAVNPVVACLADLKTCLSGSSSVAACADQAVACLEAAHPGFQPPPARGDGGAPPIPKFDAGSFPLPSPTAWPPFGRFGDDAGRP